MLFGAITSLLNINSVYCSTGNALDTEKLKKIIKTVKLEVAKRRKTGFQLVYD